MIASLDASTSTASDRIRERALALGFDAVGIAGVGPLEAARHYEAWISSGMHGGMDWLADDAPRARRLDPERVLPGLRSVVCVALCHEPESSADRDRRLGRIARYAAGGDYHAVMKDLLGSLERFISEEALPGARALWYSDTGPILERGWAERAGLGWVGKHSGLLSEKLGSWFLLGEVLVDRELAIDAPIERERCGTCTRCITACPTGAIVEPYRVDARRCISYLTIEHRGLLPRELRPSLGEWIFGCDLCQEACPWNRFAPPAREARLHARSLEGWSLERFLTLDDAAFSELFAGSPIRRTGRDGFLRNVCVALGNRGETSALPVLARALAADPDWLVRAHAAWAMGELIARANEDSRRPTDAAIADSLETLRAARGFDPSAAVREEAAAALQSAGAATDNTPV